MRREQRRETDAAEADDAALEPGVIAAVLTTAPDAGDDGATEDRRLVERQLAVDPDAGLGGDRGVFREGGHAEVMVELAAAVQAPRARQQRAHAVGLCAGLAQGRSVLQARRAMAAAGTNTVTTWSPTARRVTPSPKASTTPAPSWPSTMGIGRGRLPSMTDRSE